MTLEEFADHFGSVALDGHTWHGNLDGFNDILARWLRDAGGWLCVAVAPLRAIARGLGYPETVRRLQHRLGKCHPSNRAEVAAELEAAQAGLGPTVFDWLVEIIAIHGAGGEESEDGVELDLR